MLSVLGGSALATITGCVESSVESPSDTDTTTPPKDTGTPTDASPTGDGELSHPPGLSEDGIIDVEQVVAGHEAFLRAVSSYTDEWVLREIQPSGETGDNPTTGIVRADSNADRLWIKYQDTIYDTRVFYDGTFYEYNAAEDKVTEGTSPSGLFSEVNKEFESLSFHFIVLY